MKLKTRPPWADSCPASADHALALARVQLRAGLPARAARSIRRAAAAIGGEEGEHVGRLAALAMYDPSRALGEMERAVNEGAVKRGPNPERRNFSPS